jgi:hypothetical protein
MMSVFIVSKEGAPSLRFLQGWAAMLLVLFCLSRRAACTALTQRGVIDTLAQAFPTPAPSTSSGQALRKVREGRGTHFVADV